jgi:hypothetical protein
MALLSSAPEWAARIHLAVLLAPVAFATHVASTPLVALAKLDTDEVRRGRSGEVARAPPRFAPRIGNLEAELAATMRPWAGPPWRRRRRPCIAALRASGPAPLAGGLASEHQYRVGPGARWPGLRP